MSLIICRECGKEISDRAKACPYCGYRPRNPYVKHIIGILLSIFILSGLFCLYYFFSPKTFQWCCRHNIIPATCTEPEICTRCGLTFDEALGHSWKEATCQKPETCGRCGETRGSVSDHFWCPDESGFRVCAECGYSDGLRVEYGTLEYTYSDGTEYYEGRIGTIMKTEWFNFAVKNAYCTESLSGYKPAKGNVLVVVEIYLKNTFNETIPMFDTDFQLQWGDDSDDAYSFPISSNIILKDQLPIEYNLKKGEEKTGTLIFEVPKGNEDFSLSFLEYYEDNSEGNLFFVYFTADEK